MIIFLLHVYIFDGTHPYGNSMDFVASLFHINNINSMCERVQFILIHVCACSRFAFIIYGRLFHYYAVFLLLLLLLFDIIFFSTHSRVCLLFLSSINTVQFVCTTTNSDTWPTSDSHLLICTMNAAIGLNVYSQCEFKSMIRESENDMQTW